MITSAVSTPAPTYLKKCTIATAVIVVACAAIAALSHSQLPPMIVASSIGASAIIALAITALKNEAPTIAPKIAPPPTQINIALSLVTKTITGSFAPLVTAFTSFFGELYICNGTWWPTFVRADMDKLATTALEALTQFTQETLTKSIKTPAPAPKDKTTPDDTFYKEIYNSVMFVSYICRDCKYDEIDTFIQEAQKNTSLNPPLLNHLRDLKQYVSPKDGITGWAQSGLMQASVTVITGALARFLRCQATPLINTTFKNFPKQFLPHMTTITDICLKYLPDIIAALVMGNSRMRIKTRELTEKVLPEFKEKIDLLDKEITPKPDINELDQILPKQDINELDQILPKQKINELDQILPKQKINVIIHFLNTLKTHYKN